MIFMLKSKYINVYFFMRKLEYAIALLLCAAAVVLMPTPSSARGSVADEPLA